jgi:hypothetical protein
MSDPLRLAEMEVGYLALKVVTRLIQEGYEEANRHEEAVELFGSIYEHLTGFLHVYESNPNELIAKHIKRIGKFYLRLFDRQAGAFVLMPAGLDVPRFYMKLAEHKAQWLAVYQTTVIQGFLLLKRLTDALSKTSLTSLRHRTEEDRQESKRSQELLSGELFTHEVVSRLTELLLTFYMKLRASDLELWSNSPEEFFVEESQSSYEYSLRPCAAHLYVHILSSFKKSVSGQVLQFVENACNIQSVELPDILVVDAALSAFELGAPVFSETVKFDHMLVDVFIPKIMATNHESYRIIRRRITLVISEWVGIGCSLATRVEIYKFLMTLLDKNDHRNDVVVQLYALQALRYTIDDWDFRPEAFEPYVDTTFCQIFELLTTQLKYLEAKLAVLQVLAIIVEQLRAKVSSHFQRILAILPPLWDESGENQLVKSVILQIITKLTESAGSSAPLEELYSLAIPAIKISADPTSPLHAYLFEDALPLWKSLVENCEEPNDELLSLVTPLLKLIEHSTEHISSEIFILESYMLLAPSVMTDEFLSQLMRLFSSYVPHMTTEALMTVLEVVELITILTPLNQYGPCMAHSGLFNTLLEFLLHKESVSITSAVKIFCILSRMSFSNPREFYGLLDSSGKASAVVQDWFNRFNNIGRPRERKLNALGVTVLLPCGSEAVFQKFGPLVDIWCELLEEVNEESGDSEVYYGVDNFQEASTPEAQRRQAMFKRRDPVHTVSLKSVIKEQLIAISHSPHRQLLASLPPEVHHLLESIVQ